MLKDAKITSKQLFPFQASTAIKEQEHGIYHQLN